MDEQEQLDELNKEIDKEVEEWNKLELSPNRLRHDPESLWVMKLQLQAMMNVLLTKGLITENELNIEFKRLQLNDMRILTENYKKQKREALRAQLVDGTGRKYRG